MFYFDKSSLGKLNQVQVACLVKAGWSPCREEEYEGVWFERQGSDSRVRLLIKPQEGILGYIAQGACLSPFDFKGDARVPPFGILKSTPAEKNELKCIIEQFEGNRLNSDEVKALVEQCDKLYTEEERFVVETASNAEWHFLVFTEAEMKVQCGDPVFAMQAKIGDYTVRVDIADEIGPTFYHWQNPEQTSDFEFFALGSIGNKLTVEEKLKPFNFHLLQEAVWHFRSNLKQFYSDAAALPDDSKPSSGLRC
jgi:hypothetical protein